MIPSRQAAFAIADQGRRPASGNAEAFVTQGKQAKEVAPHKDQKKEREDPPHHVAGLKPGAGL
jgi:hypothetical protein